MQEAEELKALDVLGAHARDELGINEITQAKPLQAALASVGAFIFGGVLPLIVARVGDGAHGLFAIRLYHCFFWLCWVRLLPKQVVRALEERC
jgi:VIT1/CCC1 family predicted Fe2+/Mn2+ transporter